MNLGWGPAVRKMLKLGRGSWGTKNWPWESLGRKKQLSPVVLGPFFFFLENQGKFHLAISCTSNPRGSGVPRGGLDLLSLYSWSSPFGLPQFLLLGLQVTGQRASLSHQLPPVADAPGKYSHSSIPGKPPRGARYTQARCILPPSKIVPDCLESSSISSGQRSRMWELSWSGRSEWVPLTHHFVFLYCF